MAFRLHQGEVDMSKESELRDELRRLIIANAAIGQFIYDVATSSLSADEADRLFEEVTDEARGANEDGGDGWMDSDTSADRPHKLH
jgi:hypothetical protein